MNCSNAAYGDGTLLRDGTQPVDGTLPGAGTLPGDGTLIRDGSTLGDGTMIRGSDLSGEPAPASSTGGSPWVSAFAPDLEPADGNHSWETGEGRSYLIPVAEILAFQTLLSLYNRHFSDDQAYDSTWESFGNNLHRGWTVDRDPFETNALGHPYAGATYFGIARSTGLNFWESLGYTFLGSAVWELAGETGNPSLNDQISTGIGGAFLGEVFFRVANWCLEGGEDDVWHEVGAALASPPTGVNRLLFGERFDDLFPSRSAAVFSRALVGWSQNKHKTAEGTRTNVRDDEGFLGVEMGYGLPGKAGYEYDRPFDYFNIEATATTNKDTTFENFMIRGLIYGGKYGSGTYAGIGGVYGSYDYIAPEIFRIASTALSAGTTGQWTPWKWLAVQGTCLAGVGYGAVGTIADADIDRDYHYGIIPQGLLALRFILGERVMLDLSGRDYYLAGSGSDRQNGADNVQRFQAGMTVKVYDRHALGVYYLSSIRDAFYEDLPDRHQKISAVGLAYSYTFGNTHFGAVE